jgi:hypothetical protein
MTNEKRNAAIMDKVKRYTQHHTATPDLAQEAIERRISMNNGKDSAVSIMKIQSPETFKELFRINADGTVTGEIENASEVAKVFFKYFRDLIQRNIRQPTQSDAWQPIETYKSGKAMFYCPAITDARHSSNNKPEYYTFDRPLHRPPTHWRPLNPPLNAAQQEQSK